MPYLGYLDVVLILMIHPGRYGAPFLKKNLEKIETLRKVYKNDIEVDGHEDLNHIKLCKKAGANLFAVGSYLKENDNLDKTVKQLKAFLKI